MIVGYERSSYAEKRLFIDAVDGVDFLPVVTDPRPPYPSFFNKNENHNSSWVDDSEPVDLIHYFNQINFGSKRFITTFETTVPRFWRQEAFRAGAEVIASDVCAKLIAFSHATYRIECEPLERWAPDLYSEILSKTIVLHPPQRLLPNDPSRFLNIDPLRLVFVGADFLRKGGIPMLHALKSIRRLHPIELTIISDMKIRHNVTGSDQSEVQYCLQFVKDESSWITWHPRLPNEDVLSIVSNSHVGLLPTLAETYGYSVLEMQAAGTPVITTDIRALPETNPENVGWVLRFPHINGLATNTNRSYVIDLYADLQAQMEKVVGNILNDPSSMIRNSASSQERVASHHSPALYGRRLKAIYEAALSGVPHSEGA